MTRVHLPSVLSNTANRIVYIQEDVWEAVMKTKNTNYIQNELALSYGFKSSAGQALFKQAF